MDDCGRPLSNDERAELEQLRAEKAQRERMDAERDAAIERGRRLMEPDDDLSMPIGQKIVLLAVALMSAAIVAAILLR